MNAVTAWPPRCVAVSFTARLHLGFLDLDGGLGRRFGSIGLSLNEPRGQLTLSPASQTAVEGLERERASRYLATLLQCHNLSGAYRLTIHEAIPPHSGLGSGTQLASAVAAALRRLQGLEQDTARDARALDRGARSGVGIGLFETGGLVVDGGRSASTDAPPILCRMPFPEQWRALLVLDPTRQGIHGEPERAAFRSLAPMSAAQAGEICRLTLMGALPSIAERDIVGFGAAIARIQQLLGDYFAPAQGGRRFLSNDVETVLDFLVEEGAHGIGQSSWGPTGFAFAADDREAERLAELARARAEARGLEIRVARALNTGARVTEMAEATGQRP